MAVSTNRFTLSQLPSEGELVIVAGFSDSEVEAFPAALWDVVRFNLEVSVVEVAVGTGMRFLPFVNQGYGFTLTPHRHFRRLTL